MLKRSFICCFIIYMTVSLKDFVKIGRKDCLQSYFRIKQLCQIIAHLQQNYFQSHLLTFIFKLYIFLFLVNIYGQDIKYPSTCTHECTFCEKKWLKNSHFLYIFVNFCYIFAFFFFFLLFAKITLLFSCHRICPDERNSVKANFGGYFSNISLI